MGGLAVATGIVAGAVGLRVLLPGGDPPPPSQWLTEIEQEQLADPAVSFLPDGPIAARLREDRSPSDILDVLGLGESTKRRETASVFRYSWA